MTENIKEYESVTADFNISADGTGGFAFVTTDPEHSRVIVLMERPALVALAARMNEALAS